MVGHAGQKNQKSVALCGDQKNKEEHPSPEKNIPDRHDRHDRRHTDQENQKKKKAKYYFGVWGLCKYKEDHPGQDKNIHGRYDQWDHLSLH